MNGRSSLTTMNTATTTSASSSLLSSSSSSIWSARHVDWPLPSSGLPPRCVASSNGWMVAVLGHNNTLTRWNVRRGSSSSNSHNEQPLPIPAHSIQHLFLDPTGCHCLISSPTEGTYYCHSSTSVSTTMSNMGLNANAAAAMSGGNTSGGSAASSSSSSSSPNHQFIKILDMGITQPGFPASIDPQQPQQGMAKSCYITQVAWDRDRGTEGSSQTILLGTNHGEIFEYSLDPKPEQPPTLLYKFPTSANSSTTTSSRGGAATADDDTGGAPITGLYFHRPSNHTTVILAATSGRHKRTRFAAFFGTNPTAPSAASFRHVVHPQPPTLIELPGSIDRAVLRTCADQFGLLTETGIYYGTLDATLQTIVDSGILPLDKNNTASSTTTTTTTTSMALTPHHFIVLNEHQELQFINRVSEQVIQQERVDWMTDHAASNNSPTTPALDETAVSTAELFMDVRRPDQVWLRKGRTLVHISSSAEDRDVWKYTLQKALQQPQPASEHLLSQAQSVCTHPAQKAVLTHVRAEHYLAQGNPELAAKFFAQSPPTLAPFPDTAIRLALPNLFPRNHMNDSSTASMAATLTPKAYESLETTHKPLIAYLSDKLRILDSDAGVSTTLLGAWLAELALSEGTSVSPSLLHGDPKTLLRILTSHDAATSDVHGYAVASGDLGTAVQAALASHDGAMEALRVLNEASLDVAEPYYYRYAPQLLERAPVAASKSFLARYSQGLDPEKLLPSLMHYEQRRKEWALQRELRGESQMNLEGLKLGSKTFGEVEVHVKPSFVNDETASVKYLEGAIKLGCRSGAVYRYLISLYVAMEDEEPLLKFLRTHVPGAARAAEANKKALYAGTTRAEEILATPLDMSFALRTILSTGRHFRSAIQLYMGFGMRQQAVELALQVDPGLARDLAREATEEQKRLWLMIARSAARGGGKDVVGKVVSVLQDCGPEILSIEDVLPFLPDFAQIDQIKEQICDALTSYSSKIEGYLKEMNECDQTCDTLRQEIGRLRTHRMQMKADARCAITNKLVLNAGESFYVFPSGYVYTEAALKAEVLPSLNERQRNRVMELTEELLKEQPQLQAEYDGLIAAECPLTGSIMVESISMGFPDGMEADEAFAAAREQQAAQKQNSATAKGAKTAAASSVG